MSSNTPNLKRNPSTHSLMFFKHADDFAINKALFLAAWKVWFKRFAPKIAGGGLLDWKYAKMPIEASSNSLSDLIRDDRRFSLEVLCRMMVPWSYRNEQQVDDVFLRDYKVLFEISSLTDSNGQELMSANLSDKALQIWNAMSFAEQDDYMAYAEARVQADIEVRSKDPVVLDDQGVELIGEDTYPPYVPDKDAPDIDFVRAMIDWIQDAPFQAYYLKQAAGDTVSGWDNRLSAFFWPKPRIGYSLHHATLDPLYYRANELAKTLDKGQSWDQEWRDMAVKTAHELFQVSGTPQKDISIENVQSVMAAAVHGDEDSPAKMNSGWSYLAAVCTDHLNGQVGRLPMATWNSRVAASVISRLDFLLAEAGVSQLGERFEAIGTIPGWGGTRPRQYSLDWPNGYRSWKTQVRASRLINQVAYILNNDRLDDGSYKYPRMPLAAGGTGDWTVRGVQGVLFCDGY
ncbi:hypothetical protein [Kangiella sp. TOML190]|uniref:hypothetical protein n=1 Tax=Kangiella sp. TOML190 TaxID=2931351 RepID=UPI00203E699B|nr:hypothetical protein [Kangiella sp. TOML190]